MQNSTSVAIESQARKAALQLFDVRAACDYLQSIGVSGATICSTRTIFGQVPHVRIGKRFYVSRESLDSWITNRQRRKP